MTWRVFAGGMTTPPDEISVEEVFAKLTKPCANEAVAMLNVASRMIRDFLQASPTGAMAQSCAEYSEIQAEM